MISSELEPRQRRRLWDPDKMKFADVIRSAFTDIAATVERRKVWIALATENIFDQHRRTKLGPFWLLINYFAFALTFIFVFNPAPHGSHHAAYVAVGLLVWTFLRTLSHRQPLYSNAKTGSSRDPATDLCLRHAPCAAEPYSNRLCVARLCRNPPSRRCDAEYGLAMGSVRRWLCYRHFPCIGDAGGLRGRFFSDSRYVISNFVRVAMFVTPVFWSDGGDNALRNALYQWNPFTHFLAIVRKPLVDGEPAFDALASSQESAPGGWQS
jgi:lipopolysaccharide transport system permease protein